MNNRRTLFASWNPLPVLDRYIFREVVLSMVMVGSVLMLIVLVNTLARNLSEAAKGDLPPGEVFHMLFLQSVNYAVLLLPLALFLGIMLGFGRLYRDSEMVSLAACGVGLRRLYVAVMYFVLPITVLLAGLSIYLGPWAAQQAYIVADQAERDADILAIQPGRFTESKSGKQTIFANSISPLNSAWLEVFVEDNSGERPRVYKADRAYVESNRETGDRYLVLEDGNRYEGMPGERDYTILRYKRHAILIKEGNKKRATEKLDARPTSLLLGSNNAKEIAELQWRISVPITGLLLALLAVPLSHTPPRKGRYGQLMIAIMVYISYANLLSVAKVWVAKGQLSPTIGIWWVHLLLLLFIAYLVINQLGWQWIRGQFVRGAWMKRYERYLIKETLIGILLALLLVVALDALLAFIAELGDVGRGEYGVGAAMRFIVLTLPHRLLDLLPMAVLLGSLMSLGRLAAGSELIALRSAGVSRASITRALLKLGMVLVIIALLIGEYIVPMSEQQARNGRAVAQSSGALHKSKHGVWVRDGRAFVHIRDFYADGKLGKVTRYEFNRQGQLRSAVSARSAKYNGEEWYLFGVERSLVRESIVVSQSEMAERWSLLLDPELLSVVATGPRFLSAWDLGKYILYLRANGLATQRYELALWNKLISPLSLLVMLFFVVPFVLGPLRDVGAGKRMVMGLLFGLAFYLLNRTYYQMGQLYNFNPLFSALFPSLLVLAVTMVVLKRTR